MRDGMSLLDATVLVAKRTVKGTTEGHQGTRQSAGGRRAGKQVRDRLEPLPRRPTPKPFGRTTGRISWLER
jgi:hypothetical protein